MMFSTIGPPATWRGDVLAFSFGSVSHVAKLVTLFENVVSLVR